jgi:hypothetical protein
MTKRSEPRWQQPPHGAPVPPSPGRRGPGRSYDPFYQFEKIARDNGKPYECPEPKAERALLALLSGKAALVVMGALLAAVAFTAIVLVVSRM